MSDLISRQAAIDAIDNANDGLVEDDYTYGVQSGMEKAKYVIEDMPSAQPETNCSEFPNNSDTISDEWCTDCKEYDHEKHCCPRFNKVIRRMVEELKDGDLND